MTKTNVLCFVPELAAVIGLNEAIVLNQIHYWIEKNRGDALHYRDGRTWTFNTYKEWQEQFPFWSKNTIIRTIERLEKSGLVISANYNKHKYDRTKWYTIDYDKVIETLINNDITINPFSVMAQTQNEECVYADIGQPIPENTTKNTTEKFTPFSCNSSEEDGRKAYGEYNWVKLSDAEVSELLSMYGAETTTKAVKHLDRQAAKTNNRHGWIYWKPLIQQAIENNWGGIMDDIR